MSNEHRFIAAALSIVLFAGCSKSSPSAGYEPAEASVPLSAIPKVSGPMPASLVEANNNAILVYDAVRSGDWNSAHDNLAKLDQSLAAERADMKTAGSTGVAGGRQDLIDSTFRQLSDDIRDRHKESAMREANRITKPIAELAEMYSPPIPGELMLLKQYGHQFAIAASTDDMPLLKQTAANIRRVWLGLRPEVEARGGTVEAQHFNDLLIDLDKDGMPGELPARLSDRIFEIEGILQRPQ